MIPFSNFVAFIPALLEELKKVDDCHSTFWPKSTCEVALICVVPSLSVSSRSLLEFPVGSRPASNTRLSVAFAVKDIVSMSNGRSDFCVMTPLIVLWFRRKYVCCIVLPRWLAASCRAIVLLESVQMLIIQFAVKGKRNICRINIGSRIVYSIVTCGISEPPSWLAVES
jgi:hypothetical protein